MRTIDQQPTAGRSIDAAHRRACASPEASVPCPVCAASLKGANFERHLRDKHPDDLCGTSSGGDEELHLVGIDRRIRRTFVGLVVVWFAVLLALLVADPGQVTDGDGTAAEIARTPGAAIVAVGLLVCAVIAVLRAATFFRARLTVARDGIELRHRLGTGRRRVPLPAEVETGTLFIRRSMDPQGEGNATVEVRGVPTSELRTGIDRSPSGAPTLPVSASTGADGPRVGDASGGMSISAHLRSWSCSTHSPRPAPSIHRPNRGLADLNLRTGEWRTRSGLPLNSRVRVKTSRVRSSR